MRKKKGKLILCPTEKEFKQRELPEEKNETKEDDYGWLKLFSKERRSEKKEGGGRKEK